MTLIGRGLHRGPCIETSVCSAYKKATVYASLLDIRLNYSSRRVYTHTEPNTEPDWFIHDNIIKGSYITAAAATAASKTAIQKRRKTKVFLGVCVCVSIHFRPGQTSNENGALFLCKYIIKTLYNPLSQSVYSRPIHSDAPFISWSPSFVILELRRAGLSWSPLLLIYL